MSDRRRMKPLAVDLCCGLRQAEFFLRAYAAVQELMTGRTEYPEHMPSQICGNTPRAIALVRRPVSYLKNSRLATGFARSGNVRVSATEPSKHRVPAFSLRLIVGTPFLVFAARPQPTQFTRRRHRARGAAIATVCAWRNNLEMGPAPTTQATVFRSAFMLLAANPASALRAVAAAPLLVGALRAERLIAESASQVMHGYIIT